jgi:hypothetical protein
MAILTSRRLACGEVGYQDSRGAQGQLEENVGEPGWWYGALT